MRVLFASSAPPPISKRADFNDIGAGLPGALHAAGIDIRSIHLAAPGHLQAAVDAGARLIHAGVLQQQTFRLLETRAYATRHPVWLLDLPADAPTAASTKPNELAPYIFLSHVAAALAAGDLLSGWRADLLHAGDWRTALAIALVSDRTQRPGTVLSIADLKHQGVIPTAQVDQFGLPAAVVKAASMNAFGSFSMMKSGLAFADRVTTVSARYASDIQATPHGHGLEADFRRLGSRLSGIRNGIDTHQWNPAKDCALPSNYSPSTLDRKRFNATALRAEFGLQPESQCPLIGYVGSLSEHTGIDLLVDVVPTALAKGAQLIVLGRGAPHLEQSLTQLAKAHPGQLAVYFEGDSALERRVIAGVDMTLLTSRVDRDGLNTLRCQRYGTLPVSLPTAGAIDTVISPSNGHSKDAEANGFLAPDTSIAAFSATLMDAIELFLQQPLLWRLFQLNAMAVDGSWRSTAGAFQRLYQQLRRQAA